MRLLSNRSIKTDSQIDQISTSRQREILISKWRALPSLYWSIVVGILAIFSVLQTTLLSKWSNRGSLQETDFITREENLLSSNLQ